jgi:hypothetical protein
MTCFLRPALATRHARYAPPIAAIDTLMKLLTLAGWRIPSSEERWREPEMHFVYEVNLWRIPQSLAAPRRNPGFTWCTK